MAHHDLLLSHFSLRYASIEERVRAGQLAGFATLGLFGGRRFEKLLHEGWTPAGIAALADDHGLRIAEVEGLFGGWAGSSDAGPTEESRNEEATVFLMADAFGADHMMTIGPAAGTFGRGEVERAVVAARFGELCDRAADHGLRVGLEFVPYITDIGDLASACDIVEMADRPNAGICIDAWHFFRGDPQWDAVASLDPRRLVLLQLSDGPLTPLEPDYERDTLSNRLPPGTGEFDLTRLLAATGALDSAAYVSVEVFSTRLQSVPPGEAATELADAARRCLSALASPSA